MKKKPKKCQTCQIPFPVTPNEQKEAQAMERDNDTWKRTVSSSVAGGTAGLIRWIY